MRRNRLRRLMPPLAPAIADVPATTAAPDPEAVKRMERYDMASPAVRDLINELGDDFVAGVMDRGVTNPARIREEVEMTKRIIATAAAARAAMPPADDD